MKKFLKLSLPAIALMFLFSALAVTETKAQTGVVSEVLKRMDEHTKALTTLKANVEMTKYNSQLNESDKSEGKAMYLQQNNGRDSYVRIDWTKPVAESLAVVKKEYVLYRPALKQAIRGKVDGAKNKATSVNALSFMNMSKAQLKANFTIQYVGQENVSGAPTWHLLLTPKGKMKYKSADLWVDGNGMPIQAEVTENNNDTTTVLLTGLEKNVTVNGGDFSINLPKGTKIVEG